MCYLASFGVRYHQHLEIINNPSYIASGDIILTTEDGYRWLRYAKEYAGDGYVAGKDELSGFPEMAEKPPKVPLVSVVVAEVSRLAGLSYQESGSWLTIILSGLFIFPAGILFYLIGSPAAGIGAGLSGSLALAYLSRTSAFQIDTDMLNLFFMFSGSLFVYLSSVRRSLIYPALAGFAMFLFWRWYFHSGFTLVYLAMLIFAVRFDYKKIAVFILFSGPHLFWNSVMSILEFSGGDGFAVNVAELSGLGVFDALSLLSFNPLFSLFGILGVALFRRNLLFLYPFLLLGLMMFFRGERFGMFLAPIVGAGIGVFMSYLSRRSDRRGLISCGAVFVFMMLVAYRPSGLIPPPVVERNVYEELAGLKGKLNGDPLVISWWDSGFLIQYLTGYAVVCDGATQNKAGTRMAAELLLHSSKEIINIAKDKSVYLLLTPDMRHKIDSIIRAVDGGVGENYSHESILFSYVIGAGDMFKIDKKTPRHMNIRLYQLN